MVTRMVLLVLLLVLVGQSTEEGVRTMEKEEKRSTMEKVDAGRSIEEEEEEEVRPPLAALGYLAQYGHLLPPGGNTSMFDSFEAGLLRFQGWLGLHRTGVLDRETVAAMGRPRCGVQDRGLRGTNVTQVELGHQERAGRSRRFSFYDSGFFSDVLDMFAPRLRPFDTPGSRWRSLDLTYRTSHYPRRSGLTKAQVDEQISAAFGLWSAVTDLTFTQRSYGDVHIDIQFRSREHGDADGFDGRGGVLAHSFFPIYGGAVHFDDDEHWVTRSRDLGTHLLHVAAHEFGHALGLPHIPGDPTALMAPTIDDSMVYIVELGREDIRAIQKLYGPKTSQVATSTSTPSTPSTTTPSTIPPTPTSHRRQWLNLPWMKDTQVDGENGSEEEVGVEDDEEGSSLCQGGIPSCLVGGGAGGWAIRGDKTWALDEEGDPVGEAREVARVWPGLPQDPDAGFTWHNNLTFLFKGSNYYRYKNHTLEPGFPRRISQGFTGLPSNIDAAFLRGRSIYFTKKTKYWIFTPASMPPISRARTLPQGLSPSLGLSLSGNRTFLFSRTHYWRLNTGSISVDRLASPPYPRTTRDWWWGCRKPQALELRANGQQPLLPFLPLLFLPLLLHLLFISFSSQPRLLSTSSSSHPSLSPLSSS